MGPTEICNLALGRIGSKRITNFNDSSGSNKEIIYCRTYYEQTVKALMRSHLWRFARDRVQLSQDTVDPAFQWDYQYILPADYLRHILLYDGSDLPEGRTYVSYEIEGKRLLIDESTAFMKYIKWVDSPAEWDSLFIEVAHLQLAQKLVIPLAGGGKDGMALKADIDQELYGNKRFGRRGLLAQVRAMDRQEAEHLGRDELRTWADSRFSDWA
jgi:hypothetical protein